MPARKNTACRYCQSTSLTKYLSLGLQPPSNSFIRPDQIPVEERYPLEVYVCRDCFLSQLLDVVPAEIIFDDYVYLSSTSKALKAHYAQLAEKVTERFGLKAGHVVVDVGCNDGILLHGYSLTGLKRVGVEPSKVAKVAEESGLDVVKEFFTTTTAKAIAQKFGKAKVITATNVYVHVDNISEFTKGVRELIDDDGVFIIEASYFLDVIDQTLFDTVYHEHLCYYSLTPLAPFLGRHDLEVFDVERVALGASGPALRVYAQRKKGPHKIQPTVAKMLKDEEAWGIKDMNKYMGYAKQVEEIKKKTLKLIGDLRSKGNRIGAYGAPAKGNTLLNYFGLNTQVIEAVAENNEWKQKLVTPGSHIPIVSDEEFIKRMPQYALLLSWNYLDFFLNKSEYIKKGGKFIVPIPTPRILP